jgi:hypothetical protein
MIAILLLLLLLPFNLFAAFTVSGVTDPASVAGVAEPASVAGVESDYAPACNVANNEVGDRTDYSDCGGTCHVDVKSTEVICMAYTADCTGTLSYAYARHYGTGEDEGKVCVYSKNSAAPPDGDDLLIGCGTISSSSTENAQSASEVGGSVTASAEYWVCIVGSTSLFDIVRDDSGSGTVYYDSTGFYDTPPANLGGGLSWSSSGSRDFSMYVTIK